ncbi:Persulfide dioxygenase ETHE mitochondrial [Fasciolopsis buskii]|uniref:Persulfide dioxygenase ETHE1, mitochondrial n=1 Tax=Fasciolopsis buskii TaxID=27845 RepID=A0A8E0RUQ9_9TREM|nr:Persulfide dioxygenase ETHE mitochondrial [Fasciolopsis buski]
MASSVLPAAGTKGPLIFRQMFESVSSTYTYLLADAVTRDALIIDPVLETVDRDAKLITELKLKLGPILNTHVHADHVTGSGLLKRRFPGSFSVLGPYKEALADLKLKHGDKIPFGKFEVECRSTPGHTAGCMTYVLHEAGLVFTGDALLIRGCGRTDFQGGSSDVLYDSIHKQIFTLPDNFFVFPAHNYVGMTMSTVGEEKNYNSRLTRTKEEFIKIMSELNLGPPKQLERSLRMNIKCGIDD